MGDPLGLAYDVGTSGVKAVVVDASGRVLGSGLRTYGVATPRPGWVEQDVERILAELGLASREVIARLGLDPSEVAGVGVTAQMFCVVPVDVAGRPLRPMLSWLDQRAKAEAEAIAAKAGTDRGYGVFDAVLTAKDIVPRIAWLRTHEAWDEPRTAWYLDCKEAIVARLTGRVAIDPAGASAFRLVDPMTGDWDDAACRAADVPLTRLPPIAPAWATVGTLTREAAVLTGLPAGTPVVTGAGDVPASQIGAGATGPGDVHLSLGTAAYFGITVGEHLADPAGNLGPLRHVVPGEWVVWLEVATGGAALSWLDRSLAGIGTAKGERDFAAVDVAVEVVGDEMEGLLFAPWLTGERVPLFDDAIRAAFVGLALHHGPAHLYRAVMEGVANQIALALEYGCAYGVEPATIRAVGGGSASSAWTRIIAASLGRRLEIVADPQTVGARGAAACALVGLGLAPDLRTAVPAPVERVVEAPASDVRSARDRLARFRQLYPALRSVLGEAQARPGSDSGPASTGREPGEAGS